MVNVFDGTLISDWAMDIAAKRVGWTSREQFERSAFRSKSETDATALLAIMIEKFEPELKPDPYLVAGNRLHSAFKKREFGVPVSLALAEELRALKAEGIL